MYDSKGAAKFEHDHVCHYMAADMLAFSGVSCVCIVLELARQGNPGIETLLLTVEGMYHRLITWGPTMNTPLI